MAGHKPGGPSGGTSRSGSGFFVAFALFFAVSLPLWHTSVSVSISAVCGRADCWKAPVFGSHFLKVGVCPGGPFFPFPFCHAPGQVLPVTAFRIRWVSTWSRPRRQALIYGLPPTCIFLFPHGFCCGRKTMLRYHRPEAFLPVGGSLSPPVAASVSQVSPDLSLISGLLVCFILCLFNGSDLPEVVLLCLARSSCRIGPGFAVWLVSWNLPHGLQAFVPKLSASSSLNQTAGAAEASRPLASKKHCPGIRRL